MLLRAYREYKSQKDHKFSTITLNITGDKKAIYIKELLTKKGRHLNYLAVEFV